MAILKSATVLGNANISGTTRILLDLTLDSGIISSTTASETTVWNTNGGTIDLKSKDAASTGSNDTRGHWTVTIPGITALYDGLTIFIKLSTNYYNNGEDYNTLNVNGLGPKLVWFRYNSRATSHWQTNAELRLTYRTSAGSYKVTTSTGELVNGTTYTDGWIGDYAYYENSIGYIHHNLASIKVGDTAISYAYNPIGVNKDGLLVPMLSKPFLVNGPMYLYSSTLSANYTGSWISLVYSHYNYQIRNGANYVEGVAYKPLYLKGTISGGMFTTNTTTPYVTALPSSADGFCYYYLGETTTSTASSKYTYISFRTGCHPVYVYKNGGIQLYTDDTNYLPLSGGSLSGKLTISTSNFGNQLVLNRPSDSGTWGPSIIFLNASSFAGSLGVDTSGILYFGDNGSHKYKIWHANNDGSGSGLDADLLDGNHASAFASSTHTHSISIATDSGTNQITLAHATKYKITAGGSSYVFTTPSDTDTKVTQTVSGSGNTDYRPMIAGASSTSSTTPTFTNTTNTELALAKVIVKPDVGDLHLYNTTGNSPKMYFNSGSMTAGGSIHYDSTEECMKFTFS